jgi:hypothetical protein
MNFYALNVKTSLVILYLSDKKIKINTFLHLTHKNINLVHVFTNISIS